MLCSDSSNAQAIYTDIEPDIEIQFEGQTAFVDMDNDGTLDFGFLKTSATTSFTLVSSTQIRYLRRFWAGPEIETNEVAGIMVTHGAGYGTTYFPYALYENDEIEEDLSFQNWGYQVLGSGFYLTDGSWNYHLGKWSPDIDSAFLGVHFKGNDDCMHYGWIRCTMADSINRFIIHDYAFESKCETGILAGDTIGDTVTIAIEEINSLNATVYAFNNSVHINLNKAIRDAKINIYNLNGKMIYSNKINNQFTQIKLDEPKGVYVVKLIAGENQFVKKIYLN